MSDFQIIGIDTGKPSFEYLLDETCERLTDKQSSIIIRRIDSLEAKLTQLEKCLEALLVEPSPRSRQKR